MTTEDREITLRAHIRSLLLDYALTHLAIDYVQYTEDAVSEGLIPSLTIVPSNESTSPSLEPPLYEQISLALKLKDALLYSEQCAADPEALSLIKKSLSINRVSSLRQTVTCWSDAEDFPTTTPLSPILCASARQETPLKELGAPRDTLNSFDGLLASFQIEEVRNDEYPEQQIPSAYHSLSDRISVDAATHTDMMSLLKDCATAFHRPSTLLERTACDLSRENFLRCISPTVELPRLLSPPMFIKTLLPDSEASPRSLNSELVDYEHLGKALLSETKIEILDDEQTSQERYKQDMLVVDGWQIPHVPSSPIPPLDAVVDDLDMRWLISSSSPVHQSRVDMMEEHEIPRAERIGGFNERLALLGDKEQLANYLSFLHPVSTSPSHLPQNGVQVMRSPTSQPSSPRTSIAGIYSTLGQPPTVFAELDQFEAVLDEDNSTAVNDECNNDLRAILKLVDHELYAGTAQQLDPSSFILNEKLDERDTMLMDVPDLPPPSELELGLTLPSNLRELLDDTSDVAGGGVPHRFTGVRCLKKIKGFQSLNLELSWRPFNFANSVPTNEEVSGVAGNIQQDHVLDPQNSSSQERSDAAKALSNLLSSIELESHNVADRKWHEADMYAVGAPIGGKEDDRAALILTAAERRRTHDLSHPSYDSDNEDISDGNIEAEHLDERPLKRLKVPLSLSYDVKLFSPQLPSLPAHDIRGMNMSSKYSEDIDDSGICLPDWPAPESEAAGRQSYLELADSASDFQGPDDNLDELFSDVDPMHFGSFRRSASPPARDSARSLGPTLYCAESSMLLLSDAHDNQVKKLVASFRSESTVPGPNIDPIPSYWQGVAPQQFEQRSHLAMPTSRGTQSGVADCSNSYFANSQGGSAKQSLEAFMRLRSKKVDAISNSIPSIAVDTVMTAPVAESTAAEFPDVLSESVLLPPDQSFLPDSWHRYLASLDCIQMLGLTRALSSSECKVQLVERETLDGADILVDPYNAIVIFSLQTLPSQSESLKARVNDLSWRFSQILIIFETVPLTESGLSEKATTINHFSPPFVKAVKRFKRDLEIAEACLDKRGGVRVQFAFPMSSYFAARTIRRWGHIVQTQDRSNGQIWDDRHWLSIDEEDPDERDLAALEGMNVFAAAVILSRNSLDAFLDKPAEQRSEEFANLIGHDRINAFNKLIARRIEAMQLPSSSPPMSIDTSNPLTPLAGHHDTSSSNLHIS
ncbi:hypothetical protein BDW22DRAFT_1416471 [Trametopsis cervina]|nr:hypothetical protein BDW22DRAFT_1416471 [Trametopsis cervina]